MTSVLPRGKAYKADCTVAYIVPQPKPNAGPVAHKIIYTNSSALPLLIPLMSKAGKGG